MLPYFLLLLSASVPALVSPRKAGGVNILASLLLFVFVGFRYQTGGDWWNYYRSVLEAYGVPLREFFLVQTFEPVYALLNWFGANQFGGLVFVNSVCGLIFSFSLVRFCRSQPNSWLALTLAIPYLVIVVAMGYTRQSVAIAFEMLALLAIQSGQNLQFVLLILMGSLFHRPVLVLLALAAFNSQSFFISLPSRYVQLVKLIFIVVAGFGFYSANSTELSSFVDGYQGDYSDYSPQGAVIRIGVTAVFSAVFLSHKKSFLLSDEEAKIWTGLCLFSSLSVVALILGFLPTLVDRLALYLLPIQLFVGSRIPGTHIFGITPQGWKVVLVFFSFLFLYVWLDFANNGWVWVPYRNILF